MKNIKCETFLDYNQFKYFACQLSVLVGTKNLYKKELIYFYTANGLTAFYRLFRFLFLQRKQIWFRLRKLLLCFCVKKFYYQTCFETIKPMHRHYEMRLEFFFVIMVASIFRYNKLFCNRVEVYNVRFDEAYCVETA